jgi:hypothetical protein
MFINSLPGALRLALAANLLLGIWYLLTPSSKTHDAFKAPVGLVHKSELQQLSPRLGGEQAQLSTFERSMARMESDDIIDMGYPPYCAWMGPLEDLAQLASVFDALELGYTIERRQQPDMANPYYRVHTPKFANREIALGALDDIRASISRSGVAIDSYIVASGLLENAISLGLFAEQDNALNVQRVLAGLNVNSLVEQEVRLLTRYWIVLENTYYIEFKEEIDVALAGMTSLVSVSENLCETIAQAE